MRRVLKIALATAAIGLGTAATPAYAVVGPVVDPCTAVYVQNAIACQGYYGGNLFQGGAGSATPADLQTIIGLLLNGTASTADSLPTNNTGAYNPPYSLNYGTVLGAISGQADGDNTFDFGSLNLSGLTVFGAHFGNNTDSDVNNVSAFWLLDLGNTSTHIVTTANGQGVSNAQIFATGGGAVPEPATWAMMLLGFGGIGMAMRRTRKADGRLLQIA